MNKELIHQRFAKNLKSYDENARIQKRMAERLMDFAKKKEYDNILEIGCGTGFLTRLINENLTFKTYTAVDIVENCESFIKNINPNIQFFGEDIEVFLDKNIQNYDLIVSNATLQWIENFEPLVKKLETLLNPNGELIFSTFGKENFREIYHLLGTSLNYYSEKELKDLFKTSTITPEIHIMAFSEPKEVLRHLQLTGVNAIEQKSWTKKDLIKFENGYKNICSKRPTLTYNPIYIHTIK